MKWNPILAKKILLFCGFSSELPWCGVYNGDGPNIDPLDFFSVVNFKDNRVN